jgi:putative ABC transport system permease protein
VRTVARAFLRELLRHRVLAALQILGVACGVAAAVGMTLSARTALGSFTRAIGFLQGGATHAIQRPAGPLEERLLPALARDPAVLALAPVIDRRLRLASGEQVRVLGVDPFLDAALRPELFGAPPAGGEDARGRFLALVGGEPAALVERDLAAALGLSPGAWLATARGRVRVAGLFSSPTGEPLVVLDIGQAQRLLEAAGVVDRVDLVLDDEAGFRRRWGAGFLVQSGRERALVLEAMLGAFRVNLQALSLLALLVGVFLVYNTAVFAVATRRHDAGVLRSLGAGRGEIAAAFCAEILLLGVLGGALGGALGYLLARALTGTVGGTISALYFFLRPEPPAWSWWIPAAGVALGCVAGLLGALAPLVALARTVPVQLLGRRAPGRSAAAGARAAALAGCALAAASVGVLALPGAGVVAGIAGSFGVLLGLVLATGEALVLLGPALEALLTRLGGLPGRMAAGFIRRSLGRTAVATAAFTVALSMSIGLGTLIGSFRRSLDVWMESQINADVYVGNATEGSIPAAFAEGLRGLPGVAGLDLYRYAPILFRGQPAHVQSVDAAVLQRFARFRWVRGGDEHWDAVRRGAVIVTESFARRFGVRPGERIVLDGRDGPREFAVEAVFYDYTSEHGVIMMDRGTYGALSGDTSVNTVGVYLAAGEPARAAAVAEVRRRAAQQGYPVQLREELHRGIRRVFDATFAVTRSLRLLAVITAFFGIAGALLTLFTERRREFGVFRALGFSPGQVVGVTLLEGLGLGIASFALSAVSGTVVAVLLIRVINLRSFHWTVFFHPAWETYAAAAALAAGASLAAAAYPAWLVLRTYPQIQLREE